MDHNDVRKGILQANMIERNSGLLSAEMTIVPFVAAIFAANAAENSLLSFFLFFVVGISSFVFFLWCSEYKAPRFWMAVFFSGIWAYVTWKFVGFFMPNLPPPSAPFTHTVLHYTFQAVPAIIAFLVTMLNHHVDFEWMDDVFGKAK